MSKGTFEPAPEQASRSWRGHVRWSALFLLGWLLYEATSFGGIHTTAERRARWGGDVVPEGFVRLSAGIEDTQDLLDDVARALDVVAD